MERPSCDLLGRWHQWHTVEVVMDGSADPGAPQRLNHAVRVMRCVRCDATSWRWSVATQPSTAGSPGGDVRMVVHERRPSTRPEPA